MPQLSRRELRNSLVVIVGLASTTLAASAWFCETKSPLEAQTSGSPTATQIASSGRAWEPVMAGIERDEIEWVHPEDEVKTERSKILNGLEASF
jgi:hypothetical protein